jgi:hypothetical protein
MSYFVLYKSSQLIEAYEAAKKIVVSFQCQYLNASQSEVNHMIFPMLLFLFNQFWPIVCSFAGKIRLLAQTPVSMLVQHTE